MSDPTANFHGGAETSVAANTRAEQNRQSRMDRVEVEIKMAFSRGLTSEELEKMTGISHQSMGGIILKLIEAGRIHRPGGPEHQRKTKSGAMALICYHGPGESVGRTPREAIVTHAELLQRFANALLHGRLVGPGAQVATDALAKAGFRGRA